jgi:ribosomal protein S18 acetylase RimI-like enzyme
VLPRARGGRLGQALMRHIEGYARAEGFERLFLSTTPFLTSAIRLYERMGFRRGGEGPRRSIWDAAGDDEQGAGVTRLQPLSTRPLPTRTRSCSASSSAIGAGVG